MKNRHKIFPMIIVTIIFFVFSFIPHKAFAEAWDVLVAPVLPHNQFNPTVEYFDLRMSPGQDQDLKLELTNTSENEQKVNIQINDATTNNKGNIDYTDRWKTIARETSLELSLTDVAEAESEIVIPAKQKKTAVIHLKMPEKQFDGMVLGGIKVLLMNSGNEDQKNSKGKKSYTIAVKLTETAKPVAANLELLEVFPAKESKKNVIKATIRNDQAMTLDEIELTAEINKKNSNAIYYQTEVAGYRMAPNSRFDFIIEHEDKPFQAGDYEIHIAASSKETGQSWNWDQEFKITADEQKETNNTDTFTSWKDNLNIYITICTATLLAILLVLFLLLIRRHRQEKRYAEEMYRQRKKYEQSKKLKKKKTRPRPKAKPDSPKKNEPVKKKKGDPQTGNPKKVKKKRKVKKTPKN
ncbi:DUF916 domain-containing protein [Erwinia sp. CPCC 100877]|nr:DUF916 domain-containing protein [Erwinia sp. CPCC 100877]